MKIIRAISAAIALAVIVGCAAFDAAPATSFDEQLAYSYATTTATRNSAAQALNDGVITVPDAQHVLAVTDAAQASLDIAHKAQSSGDTKTSGAYLAMASASILTIQRYLTEHGVK